MARNNRFYKRTFLERIKEVVKNILSVFAVLVILYYYYYGTLPGTLQIFCIEFPLQVISDILLSINKLMST